MQTNPGEYDNIVDGALSIARDEGPMALALGAQATIAGYLWYGLSVYPSYTFFKTFIGKTLLSPEIAMLHVNDVALVSGALAAVIASLLLTPLEAARIRTVADPDTYRSLGLFGTLGVIANENPSNGLKTLYAGLPSLLTRQVIFGSVKFVAFERACEAIFKAWPLLQDATWTTLLVSLVAGGFSGALSSVVSQVRNQTEDVDLEFAVHRAANHNLLTALSSFSACRFGPYLCRSKWRW
jgi:solute carrier family 25 phosphate transporter 3